MEELSAVLWKERELLEVLLYKLECEQLLLVSGKTRWLNRAAEDISQVAEKLRGIGLARAVEVATIAEKIGAPEDASLRQIIDATEEGPWREILNAHLAAYLDLTGQIQHLRDANEQLLRAANRATQETMANRDTAANTYDARGFAGTNASGARLIDRDI